MPVQTENSDTTQALRALITALTARGAVARRTAEGAIRVTGLAATVSGTGANPPRPPREHANGLLEQAVRAGLVLAAGPDGDHVLTAAGRAWLKRQAAVSEPFRTQHQQRRIDFSRLPGQAVMVNDAESPLTWLRRRAGPDGQPILAEPLFQAGERLRADFTFAHLQARTTADWSGFVSAAGQGGGGRGVDLRDNVVRAKQRVSAALAAIGPELSGVVVDVCCNLHGLESVESAAGWPRRSGKVVLLLGLAALARHYGLVAAPAARAPRSSHWGTADYRPTSNKAMG